MLVLNSCDPEPDPGLRYRVGRGYLNIPRLITDLLAVLTEVSWWLGEAERERMPLMR